MLSKNMNDHTIKASSVLLVEHIKNLQSMLSNLQSMLVNLQSMLSNQTITQQLPNTSKFDTNKHTASNKEHLEALKHAQATLFHAAMLKNTPHHHNETGCVHTYNEHVNAITYHSDLLLNSLKSFE